MKIVMLSRHRRLKDTRIYHKEARSLKEAGHEVSIIHYPTKSKGLIKGLMELRGQTKKLCKRILTERPDAIHCHNIDTLPPAIRAKKALKVPLILDAHEDLPGMIFEDIRILGVTWMVYQDMVLPHMDKVITVNDTLGSFFSDPLVVQNYPPLWFGKLGNNDMRNELAPNGETVILYHGIFSEARDAGMMVKVAKKVTKRYDAKFIFIGNIYGNVKAPEDDSIRHMGKFPWLQVPDFLRAADIGFCIEKPTHRNMLGVPTKLYEYMLFAKPFVMNEEFDLVMELLEDAFCGVPCKYEVGQLVANLSELIEDKKLRKLLGTAGRKAVVDRYNWENEAKKLVRLYDELET